MGSFSFETALVTGAAGFIGSRLAERLVQAGCRVRGIDSFTDYYPPEWKRANLKALQTSGRFTLHETDLRTADLRPEVADVDVIFHHAAQPGVRASWADGFALYDSHNILATQRLLEAARSAPLKRFVYASSSSVYGEASSYPTREDQLPQPYSPYGVTKLAAEHLCVLFAANWGLPSVSLRYFTVYGPRQRPDMAIHRLIESGLGGLPFPLYGTGGQMRDFTYVDDVVEANVLAAEREVAPGTVMNIAGGSAVTVRELIELTSEAIGVAIPIETLPAQAGDVARTGGSTARAEALLHWWPITKLADGIREQVRWHRQLVRS